VLDWLLEWLTKFLDWLVEVLLWVPQKLWELFLDVLATILEAIPVPDFVANADVYLAAVPSSVAYFLGIVNFGFGLGVIITASIIRFVIRRLPGVG